MTKKESALSLEQVGLKAWRFVHPPLEGELTEAFHQGLDLMGEGLLDEAAEIFGAVVKRFPGHIDAHHHLAILAARAGDRDMALELWSLAVDLGLDSFPEAFILGEDRLEWGWMENRPFLRALQGLGLAALDRGKLQTAQQIFLQLLSLNPNDNQGIRGLAVQVAFALKEPKAVLKVCNKYRQDAMAETLYGRALAEFQLGRREKAEKALISAVSLLPLVAKELIKKRHRAPKGMDPAYLTMGGADEAYDYWMRYGPFWKDTAGAFELVTLTLAWYPTVSRKMH